MVCKFYTDNGNTHKHDQVSKSIHQLVLQSVAVSCVSGEREGTQVWMEWLVLWLSLYRTI